jgi:hypothetical protein
MAAPKTGVIKANILIVRNKDVEINGNKILLYLNPGIDKVLLVINKLVKPIVVVIPEKITAKIIISCPPKPVYLGLEENGVIKVQPDNVKVLLEHFVTYIFLRLILETRLATYQKDSGYLIVSNQKKNFKGTNEKTSCFSLLITLRAL